jgi:hypothetical protein
MGTVGLAQHLLFQDEHMGGVHAVTFEHDSRAKVSMTQDHRRFGKVFAFIR